MLCLLKVSAHLEAVRQQAVTLNKSRTEFSKQNYIWGSFHHKYKVSDYFPTVLFYNRFLFSVKTEIHVSLVRDVSVGLIL